MSKYLLVFKLLLKNQYSVRREGKKIISPIVGTLSTLPLMAVICVMLYTITQTAVQKGIFPHEVTLIIASAQVITFFFAVHGVLSTLYLSDDAGFLSSLPVSPTVVYFAKISVVYVNELIISTYVLLPSLLTVALTASAHGYYVFPAFYPLILPIILLTPLLPLAVASIVSMPLMYLSKFFKKRSVVGTVVLLILFCALFAIYFVTFPEIANTENLTNLSSGTISAIVRIANIAYPDKVVVYFSLGINPWANLGIAIGIYGGLILLITLISKAFYARAVSAQIETSKKNSAKSKKLTRQSHISALLERDFKSLVRYPGLALSSFMNVILSPIMLVVTYLATDSDSYTILLSAEESGNILVPLVQTGVAFLYSILLNSGINASATLAFSRDGKTYYLMKHLPVKPNEIIFEKVLFANIVSAVGVVLLTIIAGTVMKVGAVNALLFGLVMLIISTGTNAFSIYIDMRKPNLDWKDTSELQRGNMLILVPYLVCTALAIFIIVIASVFSAMEPIFGEIGTYALFWGLTAVIALIISVAFNLLLFKKGESLYEKMDDNKTAPKNRNRQIPLSNGFLK